MLSPTAAADSNRPVLDTHDRYGGRIDEVAFHPAYDAGWTRSRLTGWPNRARGCRSSGWRWRRWRLAWESPLADAFCALRLDTRGTAHSTFDAAIDIRAVIDRAMPA